MAFVAAKCPICNGELQFEDSMETGFCMYCGSKVIAEEAIQFKKVSIEGKVEVEGVASIDNLLARAQEFEKNGDCQKACEYYNRILDLDINNELARNRYDYLSTPLEIGSIVEATITRIIVVGAFARLPNGSEGLIHISKLDKKRVDKVEDVVSVGDVVQVKIMNVDGRGRINLSRKDALKILGR